jgi:hypothetical protein
MTTRNAEGENEHVSAHAEGVLTGWGEGMRRVWRESWSSLTV